MTKRPWRAPLAAALCAVTALAVSLASPAAAQTRFPTQPIRIMLPFAAGSVSDVTFRYLAERLGPRIGTSVIIENMPRAGGITAATTTLSANPDGHTLIVLSSSTAISMSLLKSVPYDPVKDFAPISGISTFTNILAAGADSPYKTFSEFAAAARAKPGALNVGTTTVGSTNHLATTLLRSMSKLDFVIVPFRTPADLVTSTVRNDVAAMMQSFGFVKSSLADKRLIALGSTNLKRASYAADVPTLAEQGVPDFEVVTWNALFTHVKTPPDVVERLNREIRATLEDPEVRARFLDMGLEPLPTTSDELGARMKDEVARWAEVIKDAGIQPH